jgi:PAS domain-containing protein
MGYRSHASFPLKVDGQVVGNFNLYSSDPGFFDEDEIKLLDEMAMDIGFALELNRREKDRRKTEEELRWRTAFFEAQVDSAPDGVLVIDSQDRKILQNQRMRDMMQIPKEIADDPDDVRQREYMRSSVRDPDQFIEKINFFNSHPDEVCKDEIELLNGTIVERYSSPGPRQGRQTLRQDLDSPRHHGAAATGGAIAPVAEDGGGGPVDRRDRPRFQ